MRFVDQTVLVTGGAAGIGLAAAQRFAREGARVMIADLDADRAAQAARALASGGVEALGVGCDIASVEDVQAVITTTTERWGTIDVLYNNAAVMNLGAADLDVTTTDLDIWDRTYAVNIRGTMLVCRSVIPHMLDQGAGAIVNAASIGGLLPTDGMRVAYSTTKAAVIMLTRHIAASFGSRGIRCNAIAPGIVLTESSLGVLTEDDQAANLAVNLSIRLTTPEDIAEVVAFLASDASEMINGQVLSVDGGVLAHRTDYIGG